MRVVEHTVVIDLMVPDSIYILSIEFANHPFIYPRNVEDSKPKCHVTKRSYFLEGFRDLVSLVGDHICISPVDMTQLIPYLFVYRIIPFRCLLNHITRNRV